MSETTPVWQSDVFGILRHPTEARVLLLRDGGGWTLPHVRLGRSIWVEKLGLVSDELSRVVGGRVRAYRYAEYQQDKERRWEEGVYLLEWAAPSEALTADGRWADRQEAAGLALLPPAQGAVIEDYFREAASGVVPERRPRWAEVGWFDEAAAWITARLAELGEEVVAPIEQVRNWSLSCILRARTAERTVYFKAVADTALFVNEPVVVAALAERYPAHIPAPLAIDAGRKWMLLTDFGAPIGWDAPLEAREALLCAYGKVQIAAASQPDWLLAIGCVDRRLDRLAAQIEPLFEDADILTGLDAEEVARLRSLAPRLKANCAELATYRVPQTLVHGDLHGGNTAIRDGIPIFFDWTDVCLSYPFFDLMTLLYLDTAVEIHLRDAYLALWTDFESPERLLEAWALARPLCALHQAVSYQAIMASLEARTRHENAGDGGDWLRRVLAAMPEEAPVP